MYTLITVNRSTIIKASHLRVGEAFRGTYLCSRKGKYNKLHQFYIDRCNITIVGTTMLDRMLSGIKEGEILFVKVASEGISKSKHKYHKSAIIASTATLN